MPQLQPQPTPTIQVLNTWKEPPHFTSKPAHDQLQIGLDYHADQFGTPNTPQHAYVARLLIDSGHSYTDVREQLSWRAAACSCCKQQQRRTNAVSLAISTSCPPSCSDTTTCHTASTCLFPLSTTQPFWQPGGAGQLLPSPPRHSHPLLPPTRTQRQPLRPLLHLSSCGTSPPPSSTSQSTPLLSPPIPNSPTVRNPAAPPQTPPSAAHSKEEELRNSSELALNSKRIASTHQTDLTPQQCTLSPTFRTIHCPSTRHQQHLSLPPSLRSFNPLTRPSRTTSPLSD